MLEIETGEDVPCIGVMMAVQLYIPLSEETTDLKDSLLSTSEDPAVVVEILI